MSETKEQIARFERQIVGVPMDDKTGVRYMVANRDGEIIFESHDPRQAETVRMKEFGSRTCIYNPRKVIPGQMMESLDKVRAGYIEEAQEEVTESAESATTEVEIGEDDLLCGACFGILDESLDFCPECGILIEGVVDFDDLDEGFKETMAGAVRGGTRLAHGAAQKGKPAIAAMRKAGKGGAERFHKAMSAASRAGAAGAKHAGGAVRGIKGFAKAHPKGVGRVAGVTAGAAASYGLYRGVKAIRNRKKKSVKESIADWLAANR
jgi:hypothetical protein